MAVKGIKETEKVAVGAIRTALQTWLAPQLSEISQRLTHVEVRLDAIDNRIDRLEKHMGETLRAMRNEMEARFDAVRSDIKRLDNIAELRERLASVEAKLSQHN